MARGALCDNKKNWSVQFKACNARAGAEHQTGTEDRGTDTRYKECDTATYTRVLGSLVRAGQNRPVAIDSLTVQGLSRRAGGRGWRPARPSC